MSCSCSICLAKRPPAAADPVPFMKGKEAEYTFTLTVKVPETGSACHCPRCRELIHPMLGIIIGAQVQHWLDDKDTFGIFPEQCEVIVTRENQAPIVQS